jgi:hypothetical protein
MYLSDLFRNAWYGVGNSGHMVSCIVDNGRQVTEPGFDIAGINIDVP